MEKKVLSIFKIGEFSRLTQVSIRMLRYYDEIGILRPAKIDKQTGYRLYSIDQIPILQKILLLRDIKFSAPEIAVALNNWNENSMIQQMEKKKKEIQNEIHLEEQRIGKIEMAINDIKEEKIAIHYNVFFKNIPPLKILSLRKVIHNYYCQGMLWDELFRFIEHEHIEIIHQNDNKIAIYHDQERKGFDLDVEVGIIVKELGENKDEFIFREAEQVDTMACMMVYGSYENIGNAYRSFVHWLEQHKQYNMTGLLRQIYHKGPYDEENPNKYLTEMQTPVIRKERNLL